MRKFFLFLGTSFPADLYRAACDWNSQPTKSNGLFILAPSGLILPGLTDIGGYDAMLRDFVDALLTGREPLMTLARARRDLEMLEG